MPHHAQRDFHDTLMARVPTGATFGFQGLRACDSITMENVVPLAFLIACDYGLDGPAWDARLRYFAVERGGNRRIVWTHTSLVEAYAGTLGEQIRAYLAEGKGPQYVIPYRSTEFLAALAEEARGKLTILANPVEVKTRFDDKVAFRQKAAEQGIPVPPGEVVDVGALDNSLLGRFGPRVVVSEQIGSSGNQTHLVDSTEALARTRGALIAKLGAGALVIATSFLEGPAVGAAGLVCGGRPWMSHPSVMFTGIPGCSMHRFDYAGSDYAAYRLVPEAARRKIEEATLKIGAWIAAAGYKGIYGVDFIVHEGEPYALELNPRVLGTTQLMTELEQIESTAPTTTYWHLAEFLGADARADTLARLAEPELGGYQIIIRNTRPARVRVGNAPAPGIYVAGRNGPAFVREAHRLADVQSPEEILLTCSPPRKGTIVEPRGAFCKLEGVSSIYAGGEKQISPAARDMIDDFTRSLALSPA